MISPYQYVIYLLSKKEYSEYAIRKKLAKKEYSSKEIDDVIVKIKEQNYLNNDRFAKIKIKHLVRKGSGANFIKQKMKFEENIEVSNDLINSILEENNLDFQKEAVNLITKKFKKCDFANLSIEEFAKIYNHLRIKGHSDSTIKSAIKSLKENYTL